MSSSAERQAWIERATVAFRQHFKWCGYEIPANVRLSIGIPKGRHGGKKEVGQCWPATASSDGYYEIFASPEFGHGGQPNSNTTAYMLETVAHELIHAAVGLECGHKGKFKDCALAVGFIGPMTTTPSGDGMKAMIGRIIADLGDFPAGALDISQRKKQGTRLLKCQCESCGYIARVTEKWLTLAGAPICPVDEEAMMICE